MKMHSWVENASDSIAYELRLFSWGKPEDYFHPMNRDHWVAQFCDYLAKKQRQSAEVRPSND